MLLALQILVALAGPAPSAPANPPAPPADTIVRPVLPTLGPQLPAPLPRWRPTPPPPLQPGPLQPADTGRRRPMAVEYSDFYNTRLTIHRYASYAMLPLFVAQYIAGEDLLKHGSSASSFARNWHRPLASGVAVLFGVNTVTGVWNLLDSRRDPAGRTRRTIHSLLMLTADAGFVATGIVASQAHNSVDRRSLHQRLAIGSMAVAAVGDLMMLVWKD